MIEENQYTSGTAVHSQWMQRKTGRVGSCDAVTRAAIIVRKLLL